MSEFATYRKRDEQDKERAERAAFNFILSLCLGTTAGVHFQSVSAAALGFMLAMLYLLK
jgi:hypothetical protein